MKKTILSWLALALLTVGAPLAKAQDDSSETKPVLVASFSGYAELKRDLNYFGTLAGNPDIAAGFEQLLLLFTQGQGLAGLDQARPWGASVSITADGSEFPALVFLPVTDLSKLLDALAAIVGEADDAGDDIFEIKRGTNTYFIKQNGKWAYLAQQKGDLETLPSDPAKLFRGLDKKYDLALSINIQNIPQSFRDTAAEFIKQGLDAKLQQSMDDDEEGESDSHAEMARHQAAEMIKRINELDQITLGLNVDRPESRTYLDIEVTGVPGSDAAKELAGSEEVEGTRFGGMLSPEALFSLHINSPASEDDEEQAEQMLDYVRTQLNNEIDKDDDLKDDQKEVAKDLAGKLVGIVADTIEEKGRLNAGLTVIGEGPLTVALGVLVSDAGKLESVIKQFVELAVKHDELPKPKFNAEKYKGFRFHTVAVPVSDDDENADKVRATLGDPVKVALAFSDDLFYVAAGENGIATIKKVIDGSAETPTEKLPPLTISLALASVLKLADAQGNPNAKSLAQNLKGGKDHVKLTVEPVDNGVRYRIEAEEGINKLLGSRLGNAARAGGQ
ncbi:MAG TPA: hypothetical protein VHC22_21475 [Pirellulales bacterium]|nr:hypothetical protein [Pirellulales bacterium]